MVPVTLRNLSKRFGPVTAVDAVDLDIPAGSLFFLLGPSGCGKTTLLRMLAGFIDPDAGSIRFADHDVTRLPPNKRSTGMVFQSYALWPHMTVAKNVEFGLKVRKRPATERIHRVADALDMVQMSHLADRKPNQLSGGQQQRVALARALVVRPDILLLDEPLSNLDAKLRVEMRSSIRQICKQAGLTAVYVTHDQKEALSMADHMAVMHRGRIEQVGPPRHLYDRPNSRFVADFLGETNFIPGQIASQSPDLTSIQTPAGTLRSSITFPDLSPGSPITCSIRPESIRIFTDNHSSISATANTLDAQLIDTLYLGETAQHRLRINDALTLKAYELNPRPLEDRRRLKIAFDPRDVVLIREPNGKT